jgi:hypothetical protein
MTAPGLGFGLPSSGCLALVPIGRGAKEIGIASAPRARSLSLKRRQKILQQRAVFVVTLDLPGLLGTSPFGDRLRRAFLDPKGSCDA